MNYIKTILVLQLIAGLASCQDLLVKEHILGNYYLVASDELDGTGLSYRDSLDGTNYGTVIEATVFAVGYNNNYMIAKQHPRVFPNPPNKNITNYYILPLKKGMDWETMNGLIGPLTLEQFNHKRKELNIPDELTFTREIDNLK